jgi:hypothetical protein
MPTLNRPAADAAVVGAGHSRNEATPQLPLDAALGYAMISWQVFPCCWQAERRKRPLTEHGFKDASCGPSVIIHWWRRWPQALIGVPTGRDGGFIVLDVDVKDGRYGFDALDALGFTILPETPMAHTPSGGLHLYFAIPEGVDLRNTAGKRGVGIGPGLDWRGSGGYVIAPSPGSGYTWDPLWNFETVALASVPQALLPREPERIAVARPIKPTTGLSPYAEAALDGACRRIIAAPAGEQESTLNSECFSLGTLAGAGAVPAEFARRTLTWAARQMPDHDPRWPWQARQIEGKVHRAFDAGMERPRQVRRA